MAYHAPVGEEPYLSVAFSVDGPIQGLHGDAFLEHAQHRFGQLMAGWGSIQKLVSGIQIVTRVLPADSAAHELWLQEQLDPDAPVELQADYAELLDERTAKSFVQRHFVVIRWNVNAQWHQVAGRRGTGLASWLSIVVDQLAVGDGPAHRGHVPECASPVGSPDGCGAAAPAAPGMADRPGIGRERRPGVRVARVLVALARRVVMDGGGVRSPPTRSSRN